MHGIKLTTSEEITQARSYLQVSFNLCLIWNCFIVLLQERIAKTPALSLFNCQTDKKPWVQQNI